MSTEQLNTNRRNILSLSIANIVSRAIEFCIPLALVRLLPADAFGGYRILWLIAGTVMIIAPLGMPGSLLYFVPRTDSEYEKHIFSQQTAVYMAFIAFLAAIILSMLTVKGVPEHSHYLVPISFFSCCCIIYRHSSKC